MLQQTQVERVLNKYKSHPDISSFFVHGRPSCRYPEGLAGTGL
jgi:hypothetical protein